MIPLISKSDFETYKALSANLNVEKQLLPNVIDAQQMDLKPLVGSAFYLSIYNEVTTGFSLYQELWEGSTWTASDGRTYRHEGLKTVLIYFAYYRYVMNSSQNETAFGIVQKLEQYSQQVSEKTIQRKIDNARSAALSYWNDVEWFLNSNFQDYPLWLYACSEEKKRSKVSSVDGNDSRISKDNKHKTFYRDRYL